MQKSLIFSGHITTLEPVNVTLAEREGMPKDNRGRPYIPASSLRGLLRHRAMEAAQAIYVEKGQPLSVDDIYMLAQGVDTSRRYADVIKNGSVSVGANNRYRVNPQMSLFGRWQMRGKLAVGNAYADSKDALITVGDGARSHVFERSESLMGFVSAGELDYLSEILNADSVSAEAVGDIKAQIKSLQKQIRLADDSIEREQLNAQIEELKLKQREVKDARVGASESIRRPIEGFEAIAPHVQLEHRFRLVSPTDKEIEYFLWCLALFSTNPTIGGHVNLGCGLVSGEWDIYETNLTQMTPKLVGHVSVDMVDGFKFNYESNPNINPDNITQALKDGTLDLSKFE